MNFRSGIPAAVVAIAFALGCHNGSSPLHTLSRSTDNRSADIAMEGAAQTSPISPKPEPAHLPPGDELPEATPTTASGGNRVSQDEPNQPLPDPTLAPAPTSTPTATPIQRQVICKAPRHYSFAITSPSGIPCSASGSRSVFDVAIPDKGRAIALLRVGVRHTGNGPTHYWVTTVGVGEHLYREALGDDICPGTFPVAKPNMGYGRLTDVNSTVRATIAQNSTICNSGAIVLASAYLDVWVEDDQQECVGKSLFFVSSRDTYKSGSLFDWTAEMRDILSLSVRSATDSQARVLSTVEGTPHYTTQSCGNEVMSLTSETRMDQLLVSQTRQIVPGGPGMTHLVMGTNKAIAMTKGDHVFRMRVGKATDARVTTGGVFGYATLGVIVEPSAPTQAPTP